MLFSNFFNFFNFFSFLDFFDFPYSVHVFNTEFFSFSSFHGQPSAMGLVVGVLA